MIDTWIIQDIEKHIKTRGRVVVLDPTEQFAFLLPILRKQGYALLETKRTLKEVGQMVKEELLLRHEAESKLKDEKVVFYVTRPKEQMSFLFDYQFTHGCIDLSYPAEWLRNKLFSVTGMQVSLDNPLLLTAAKVSLGKSIDWWTKILLGIDQIIDLDLELLPFLDNPDKYQSSIDADVYALFEHKLFDLMGQQPRTVAPAVLAGELVKTLFDQLLNNEVHPTLLDIYYKWLDSNTYSSSLDRYISNYPLAETLNYWNVHPDHCFVEVDNRQLRGIANNFRNKDYVRDKMDKLYPRMKSRKAARFVPTWWNDVKLLSEFNNKPLNDCRSFEQVVQFYTNHFYKLDRSIRNIYAHFIQEKDVVRPLQEQYESLCHELMDRWYEYDDEYKSNQQGFLPTLFKQAQPGIAVIVGDGIRYEMAAHVAAVLKGKCNVTTDTMLADMPSETEHNMSALYVGNNEVISIHKEREKKLTELCGKEIVYLDLEALHYGIKADYLVLTYKDIDSTGEKLQLGAIKLFSEFEKVLSDSIELLLNMGYREVQLVTDHGFVLTGILDESDKIDPDFAGKKDVHERYIRTTERINNSEWSMFDSPYGEYKYLYTAKTHKPFKSKGVYGFAHGGFTPQEIIIPHFVFKKETGIIPGLSVTITNKSTLNDVTGEIFSLKIQGAGKTDNVFEASRKIQVFLYSNHVNISSSSIITIVAGKEQSLEFSCKGQNELLAVVVDASTQEQLDSATIKKSSARDLGGLL